MILFLADENFDGRVFGALLRELPKDAIVRAQDVGLEEEEDPLILEWAAQRERILLTHDVSTMTKFAYERVVRGLKMPGVFEVSCDGSIRIVIFDLLLVFHCSEPSEWENQVRYIPL